MILSLAACAGDNVHQPSPDEPTMDNEIAGKLYSTIPAFEGWGPIINDVNVELDWADNTHRNASIVIDEFSLYIDVVDLSITIGSMTIEKVPFTYADDGTATFSLADFETMAGQYDTHGSIAGTYDPSTGAMTFVMEYKPGSMPFLVRSEFISL